MLIAYPAETPNYQPARSSAQRGGRADQGRKASRPLPQGHPAENGSGLIYRRLRQHPARDGLVQAELLFQGKGQWPGSAGPRAQGQDGCHGSTAKLSLSSLCALSIRTNTDALEKTSKQSNN